MNLNVLNSVRQQILSPMFHTVKNFLLIQMNAQSIAMRNNEEQSWNNFIHSACNYITNELSPNIKLIFYQDGK